MNLKKIDKEIEELNDKLAQLRRDRMILERAERELTESQKLAIELHELQCHGNHGDGCGWFYEIKNGVHSWTNGSSHEHWHTKAKRLTAICCQNGVPPSTALEIIKTAK